MAQRGSCGTPREGRETATQLVEPLHLSVERVFEERAELSSEVEALEGFDSRLSEMPVEMPPSTKTPRHLLRAQSEPGSSSLIPRVCEAYRETVMSVPHYNRTYGECLRENFGAEFGEEFAVMLDERSGAFTPTRRRTLRSAVRLAISRRLDFMEILELEISSLEEADETCTSITERITCSKPLAIGELSEYIEELNRVVEDRQAHFRTVERRFSTRCEFCTYLYDEEAWTFPVLYTCALLRDCIEGELP